MVHPSSRNFPKALFLLILLLSASLPSRLSAWTAQDYYLAGVEFYARKDYPKAAAYLEAAGKMDPGNWQAFETLGYIHYLSSRPSQALAAFDQSLRRHPENPKVRDLAEGIRARLVWEAERLDIYPRVFRNYDIWASVHGGVITASLGDLTPAVGAFLKAYPGLQPSARVDGLGLLAGLEVGFMMDKLNAWAITVDGASFGGYRTERLDNLGNKLREAFQPDMLAFQAGYYRYFPIGRFRLFAGAGGGLYHTIINLDYKFDDGTPIQEGQVTGIGWGGTLAVGFEAALGEQFSASVAARGRYATVGHIHGAVTYGTGATEDLSLAKTSDGYLEAYSTDIINTYGLQYAKVDFTGADLILSVSYHY